MKILIKGGVARAIYDDDLHGVMQKLGKTNIHRASRVEPSEAGWTADMALSGGPVLGPFPRKNEAVAAEVAWITENSLRNSPGKRAGSLVAAATAPQPECA